LEASRRIGAMKITFNVGESSAQFHRDPFFGLANLVIDGKKTTLASLWQLGTQYDLRTTKVWTVSHGEHTVEIEKVRPQWLGGLRPNTYTIKVDGAEVATSRGF
jgi:hypothetical protein